MPELTGTQNIVLRSILPLHTRTNERHHFQASFPSIPPLIPSSPHPQSPSSPKPQFYTFNICFNICFNNQPSSNYHQMCGSRTRMSLNQNTDADSRPCLSRPTNLLLHKPPQTQTSVQQRLRSGTARELTAWGTLGHGS